MILHFVDGHGWTCDVPVSAEMWALYKRAARRQRMKVADWLAVAITEGSKSLLAEHRLK